jgi:NADPH2:quinone reductase
VCFQQEGDTDLKAVGYKIPSPITDDASLIDIELPKPTPTGHDILVEVKAVSVNPVDYKVRRSTAPQDSDWKVIGWDAAGIVVAAGPDVNLFKVGDEVFYAGSIIRSGTNAQFHLVDERIVGRKPQSLNWAEAAALPLTSLTAWEALFDRMDVKRPVPGAASAIVIIGGAGGVGSIAIQIARQCTDLTVIATASRPETREWVKQLGAHHVIDHSKPLAAQVAGLEIGAPAFVFSTTQTEKHVSEIADLIAPQGRFGLIDDPEDFDIMLFKRKAVSIHHELMFTRAIYGTPDIGEQGKLLNDVSSLVDAGKIRTTLTERLAPINAANLKSAHALIESGTARGKVALEGWPSA